MTHSILETLPTIEDGLQKIREILLANAIMFGEITAPTFEEEGRIRFLLDRFTESGLQNISCDEVGNGVGVLPGQASRGNILVVAHADSPFPKSTHHSISVQEGCLVGPGIADNAIGMATIASLPTILERLGIRLQNNLMLLGCTRSLGRGNLEGIRFFLDNNKEPIYNAVTLKGFQLGRLSCASLGIVRGEITCKVPTEYDWTRFGAASAISTLNNVISKIHGIPLPQEPKTSFVLGSISGGTGYSTLATSAQLRFELRSEQKEMVQNILKQLEEIIEEAALETQSTVTLNIIAQGDPGLTPYTHPLVSDTREIMNSLGIQPTLVPAAGELSPLVAKSIPTVTIGITDSENVHETNESIAIDPMFTGLALLVGIIQAIDKNCSHGQN